MSKSERTKSGNNKKRQSFLELQKFDTDVAAREIWLRLLSDFRTTEGDSFCIKAEEAFKSGISTFRDFSFPELGIISPARFKRYKQLESLLKKYRFKFDRFSDQDLELKTLTSYMDEQVLFSRPRADVKPLVHLVLQRARKHAKRILGNYNPDATVCLSRFGKKSSIGCPLSLAYIDYKLTNVRAFTSSTECAAWFRSAVVSDDSILRELVHMMGIKPDMSDLAIHDTLKLVLVPKAWNKFRPITPLTLLSLFYSYGIGEQITSCLKVEGLDISRLQERHARLVRAASVNRRLATCDLSSASQSLLSDLLNRVLPREWYTAIKKTFHHNCEFKLADGKEMNFYAESVLPMGNGLTFPAETLVFYVVLKAIAELAGVKGLISVYGDDLIYPSSLHKFVAVIFPHLMFRLNLDKTFVKAPFRESCGSDYYRGVDVRPSFLPDKHQLLNRIDYAVFLNKCYNALIRRWDINEIPTAAHFILSEITRTAGSVARVPPCYPDTAGVKVESPGFTPLDGHDIIWTPVVVRFYSGSRWFHFHYYSQKPSKRAVLHALPHYWLALQGRSDDLDEFKSFWETDYSFLRTAPRCSIEWKTLKRVTLYKTPDGKVNRKVLSKQLAMSCARDVRTTLTKTRRESVSDWLGHLYPPSL